MSVRLWHWIKPEQNRQVQTHRNTNVQSIGQVPTRSFHGQDSCAPTIAILVFGQENGMGLRLHTASNPCNTTKVKHAGIQTAVPTIRPESFRSSHQHNQNKCTLVIAIMVYFDVEWGWDYDLTLNRTPTTQPKSSTGMQTYGHFHFSCFLCFPDIKNFIIIKSGRMSNCCQPNYR